MNRTVARPKIFGVGLNKTGTSTLGYCGKILGYRCTSCNRKLLEDVVLRNDLTHLKKVADQYDFFEDWPWPLVYKELDNMFPGSRFILTTRSHERKWLDSLKEHSMRTHPTKHCRKLVYGYNFPHKNEREHIEFYKRHIEGVRTYFHGREKDLLEVCWENGDGWAKLCAFLRRDVPDVPFPHINKGVDQTAGKKWWSPVNRLLSLTGI
jgi:hypothetical protein